MAGHITWFKVPSFLAAIEIIAGETVDGTSSGAAPDGTAAGRVTATTAAIYASRASPTPATASATTGVYIAAGNFADIVAGPGDKINVQDA